MDKYPFFKRRKNINLDIELSIDWRNSSIQASDIPLSYLQTIMEGEQND